MSKKAIEQIREAKKKVARIKKIRINNRLTMQDNYNNDDNNESSEI